MADIRDWGNTATDPKNASAPPDGAPEGWAPSEVNDWGREIMAAMRRFTEDGSFFDWGDTITYVDGSTIDAQGDGTTADRYLLGRTIRITGSTTGSVTGLIRKVAGDLNVTISGTGTIQNDGDLRASLGPEDVAVSGTTVTRLSGDPIGKVVAFPIPNTAATPLGWAPCNGQLLDIVEFPALYDVIGQAFGGSGGQFATPDLRGRVVCGENGSLTGVFPLIGNNYGNLYNSYQHLLTSSQYGQRQHTINTNGVVTGVNSTVSVTSLSGTVSGITSTPLNQPAEYEQGGANLQALNTGGSGVSVPGTFSGSITSGSGSGTAAQTGTGNAAISYSIPAVAPTVPVDTGQPTMVMRWFIRAL